MPKNYRQLTVTTQLPFLVNLVPAIPLAVIMVTGI